MLNSEKKDSIDPSSADPGAPPPPCLDNPLIAETHKCLEDTDISLEDLKIALDRNAPDFIFFFRAAG